MIVSITRAVVLCVAVCAMACDGNGASRDDALPTPTEVPPTSTVAPSPSPTAALERTVWLAGSTGGAGVVLASMDGGNSWVETLTAETALRGIDFVDRSTGWVVGDEQILRSDDGGATWQDQRPAAAVSTALLSSVRLRDTATGFAVGQERPELGTFTGAPLVLRTVDGGATWTRSVVVESSNPATRLATLRDVCLDGAGNGVAVGFGTAGTVVLRTGDDGGIWSDVTARVFAQSRVADGLFGVACSPGRFWLVGDANAARVFHSSDGGESWDDQSFFAPEGSALRAVVFVTPEEGWVVGRSGGRPFVARTFDGGVTWGAESVEPQSLAGDLFAVEVLPGGVGFAGGRSPGATELVPVVLRKAPEANSWSFTNVPAAIEVLGIAAVP